MNHFLSWSRSDTYRFPLLSFSVRKNSNTVHPGILCSFICSHCKPLMTWPQNDTYSCWVLEVFKLTYSSWISQRKVQCVCFCTPGLLLNHRGSLRILSCREPCGKKEKASQALPPGNLEFCISGVSHHGKEKHKANKRLTSVWSWKCFMHSSSHRTPEAGC